MSTAQSTALFTESTATTTRTTSSLPVTINVSDTSVGTSGVSFGTQSTPISPLRHDDLDTMSGDDRYVLEDIHYSPFKVKQSSMDDDDDAPITKSQFMVLQDKLDSLIESSKSSSNLEYSIESYKAFLETVTIEHASKLAKTNKFVEDSQHTFKDSTEKVEKLLSDVQTLMGEFKVPSESNTATVNKVITSLGTSLQTKNYALKKVRTEIQVYNSEFQTSISSKIEKL